MRVCFFGIYDKDYSRNKVLLAGFRRLGWEVSECVVDPKRSGRLGKYWSLFQRRRQLSKQDFDLILVAFPAQPVAWLARILFPTRKIIVDLFLSLYDSNVSDRQLYSRYSWRSGRDWWLDWSAGRFGNWLLLDTFQHINYFSQQFHLPLGKFIRVFVGADDELFLGRERRVDSTGVFRVHFHGSFIPLQGVETIVRAAELLAGDPAIEFFLIGTGQDFERIKRLALSFGLKNIKFLPRKTLAEIADSLQTANLSLGIFGLSAKAGRVIPNKVFESVAAGCPVITADSPALRELFNPGQDIIVCPAGDPRALADKIRWCRSNSQVAESIAARARDLFRRRLLSELLVEEMLKVVYDKTDNV